MAKFKLAKKEIDRIMKIEGNISGTIFKAYENFILQRKGEKGVKLVEKRMKEIGHPIKFNKFSSFRWYSEALACVTCLTMLEIFSWDESAAFEIGYEAPSSSVLTKLLLRYFSSTEATVKNFPKYYKRHVDFGKMECVRFDEKKRESLWRLYGFKKFHPIVYDYIRGYLSKITEMTTEGKTADTKQTKSLYNGDSYDEFKITWS